METTIKFCIDCAFCGTNASRDAASYRCFAPENLSGFHLVSGDKIYHTPLCTNSRYNEPKGCTEAGNWFKAKPLPTLQILQEQEITAAKYKSKNKVDISEL